MSSAVRRIAGGLVLCAVILTASTVAHAADPDYQGTYAGVVTTNTGKAVPVTFFIRDDGDTAAITASAMGYTVRVSAPESWAGDGTLQLVPVVPRIYSAILSGKATMVLEAKEKTWFLTGSGTGTALALYSGSAQGSATRVSRGMNREAADAWHAANPAGGPAPPKATPAVAAIERGTAPLAPALQAPIPDAERTAALAVAGLFIAVMLVSWVILGGKGLTSEEIDGFLRSISGSDADVAGGGESS